MSTSPFEPAAEATRAHLHMSSKTMTLFAKLMTPAGCLFAGAVKKSMNTGLDEIDELKMACEAG